MSSCKGINGLITDLHGHLEPSVLHSSNIPSSADCTRDQGISIDHERTYLNLNSSQTSSCSPVSLSNEYSQSNLKRAPDAISQYGTNALLYQPSLAAGGVVDLSRTFTLTHHGTFSFGRKKNSSNISNKTKISSSLQNSHITNQYNNGDSFRNFSLSPFQNSCSPMSEQSVDSPESFQSIAALELRLEKIDEGKCFIPPTFVADTHDSKAPAQVIIAVPVPATVSTHLGETSIPLLQTRIRASSVQSVITSSDIQYTFHRDSQNPVTGWERVKRPSQGTLQLGIQEANSIDDIHSSVVPNGALKVIPERINISIPTQNLL